MHPLQQYFQHWKPIEIEDHLETWRQRGPGSLQIRMDRGRLMADFLADPQCTPEEYDDFRVVVFECVPMLRTIKRKWAEMPSILAAENAADQAVYQFLFGEKS